MRTSLVVALMTFASAALAAPEAPVMFHVTVKSDGRVVDSPSFLAAVGQPATVRLSSGVAVEALAKPVESDGGAWTQVRITYFETPTAKFVQEMSQHNPLGMRTGSFEYTDPANRRYLIKVGGQRAASAPADVINLDRPGQLEALERENPARYGKVLQIIEAASRMPCDNEFRRSLSVKFEARDIDCSLLILTSFPSRRHLTFELEGVSYAGRVTMDESQYRFVPMNLK